MFRASVMLKRDPISPDGFRAKIRLPPDSGYAFASAVLVSVCLSLAALSRYNLGPLLVLTILLLEGGNKIKSAGEWKKNLYYLIIVPGVLFFLVTSFLYWRLGLTELWRAPIFVIDQLWGYLSFLQAQSHLYEETRKEIFGFLLNAASWPLLLLMVFGVIVAFYKKREGFILHFAWLAVFLAFHTFLLHQGMIVVGLPYSFKGQSEKAQISGCSPYGASTIADGSGDRPTSNELDGARFQGQHVAQISKWLVNGKQ